MGKICGFLFLLVLAQTICPASRGEPLLSDKDVAVPPIAPQVENPSSTSAEKETNLISCHLADVTLSDVIKMMALYPGVNFSVIPDDARLQKKRLSVAIDSRPWKTALAELLNAQGFVLLKDPLIEKAYSIVETTSPVEAAKFQSAQSTLDFANEMSQLMKAGNLKDADQLLQAFAAEQRTALDKIASLPTTGKKIGKIHQHVVEQGETLGVIALKWGVTESAIMEVNGMKSNRVIIGEILMIPER